LERRIDVTTPDERPILVCRIECPERMQADVDAWMPKHFDDSLEHPKVTSAANYRVVRDYRPVAEGGLPSVLNGHGNRFIVYVAEDMPGVADWLDSPMIRRAIEDGAEREGQYPALDGEPFTGNIYEIRQVRGAVGADFAGTGPILAERFEVPEHLIREFETWLDGPHLDAAVELPGAIRVRTWSSNRGLPKRFPYIRYQSKGNRMIWTEFAEGTDLRAVLAEPMTHAYLEDSIRWDLRLSYVRREVAENLLIRTAEEARSEAMQEA
jgi:hypothetical protein